MSVDGIHPVESWRALPSEQRRRVLFALRSYVTALRMASVETVQRGPFEAQFNRLGAEAYEVAIAVLADAGGEVEA